MEPQTFQLRSCAQKVELNGDIFTAGLNKIFHTLLQWSEQTLLKKKT